MQRILLCVLLSLTFLTISAQKSKFDSLELRKDFEKILHDLETDYVYYNKKNVDLDCLKSFYGEKIKNVKNSSEALLFFEFMLYEFYDSHLHITTYSNKSYRIYSPIYASMIDDRVIITDYWKDQVKTNLENEIIGSEIIALNGELLENVIEKFPTHCHNKKDGEIRTWIINKILAGKYSEKRKLTLKLKNGELIEFDLDAVKLRTDEGILSYRIADNIGIIRVNNSLGNIFSRFAINRALRRLKKTDGIIIDIRNSPNGGSTFAAYPLISHFIKKSVPFQKYELIDGSHKTDQLKSKKPYINKPMVLVVGRWTGSVGEGLASGVKSNEIGVVVGTEMQKLAGSMCGHKFNHIPYDYQMPCIDVQQLNGKSRTDLKPNILITNDNSQDDLFIKEAIKIIKKVAF
jgi:carboxyl-terminal processing protease